MYKHHQLKTNLCSTIARVDHRHRESVELHSEQRSGVKVKQGPPKQGPWVSILLVKWGPGTGIKVKRGPPPPQAGYTLSKKKIKCFELCEAFQTTSFTCMGMQNVQKLEKC